MRRKIKFLTGVLTMVMTAAMIVGCSPESSSRTKSKFYIPSQWKKPIKTVSAEKPQLKTPKHTPSDKSQPKTKKYIPAEQMTGYASWYGPGFHGKQTANGEIYNQNVLTAAHKILPMNTRLRVTNLENDRSIVVRVNDRGPYKKNRIIDLTKAGAAKLGFLKQGVTRVSLEILKYPVDYNPKSGLAPYKQTIVQLGVFRNYKIAVDFKKKLAGSYKDIPFILEGYANDTHRLIAGPYRKRSKAVKVSNFLKSRGLDNLVRSYKK